MESSLWRRRRLVESSPISRQDVAAVSRSRVGEVASYYLFRSVGEMVRKIHDTITMCSAVIHSRSVMVDADIVDDDPSMKFYSTVKVACNVPLEKSNSHSKKEGSFDS
ncbi:hypothetical protein Tco_0917659 [Tanacetum coccineum]